MSQSSTQCLNLSGPDCRGLRPSCQVPEAKLRTKFGNRKTIGRGDSEEAVAVKLCLGCDTGRKEIAVVSIEVNDGESNCFTVNDRLQKAKIIDSQCVKQMREYRSTIRPM